MFHPLTRFGLAPHVVTEQYENEALAINLDSGTYYSMTGASSMLWAMVRNNETANAIVQAFNPGTAVAVDAHATAVDEFLLRLAGERLIIPIEPTDSQASLTAAPTGAAKSTDNTAPSFALEIFTDMQDLLLLDPIHDVEDEGWPVARHAGPDPR